jgi:hypothetical protein
MAFNVFLPDRNIINTYLMALTFLKFHFHETFHFLKTTIWVVICATFFLKELNLRLRVYVEIAKPSRVELKHDFSDTRECFGIST